MKIGIDAKRIFLNKTGLGSYGRNLINGFNEIDKTNEFYLYTTKKSNLFNINCFNSNFTTKESKSFFKALWRTSLISNELKSDKIEIYHGISNELPIGLDKNIKKIVDIHDLLFIRFPNFYSYIDRQVFLFKTKMACKNADKIIATSQATKNDIVNYYNIDPEKIEVVYQCCDKTFYKQINEKEKELIQKKYLLPKEFILCVGTIQQRKNQMQILEALKITKHKIPLVLVGSGGQYKNDLIKFASNNKIQLIIPNQFVTNKDLPAIYQLAKIFVFPGFYEGFGIPVLEAMASKTPVITSINTSMSEIIQDTSCLINPLSTEDLAGKIDEYLSSRNDKQVNKNYQRALNFTNENFAKAVLKIYQNL